MRRPLARLITESLQLGYKGLLRAQLVAAFPAKAFEDAQQRVSHFARLGLDEVVGGAAAEGAPDGGRVISIRGDDHGDVRQLVAETAELQIGLLALDREKDAVRPGSKGAFESEPAVLEAGRRDTELVCQRLGHRGTASCLRVDKEEIHN